MLRNLGGSRSPHLVICPASLIQNWAREFKQWCPSARVLMYHGKERDTVREAVQRWRKKVQAALKDGLITEVGRGVATSLLANILLHRYHSIARVKIQDGHMCGKQLLIDLCLPLQLPPGMLVQPDEEEKEAEADADLLADPLEYQDEDAFEDRVAAADFDETRPVGGLTVGAGGGSHSPH